VTDAEVMDAVIRAVGRHGPARLTLAHVADEAGISPAALVQRFGSKRALLLAVGTHSAQRLHTAVDQAMTTTGSPLAGLRSVLTGLVEGIDSPRTLANHVAFLQLDLGDDDFRREAQRQARTLQRAIERLLDAAVGAGELPALDTRRLAVVIHTTFNGSMITWALAGRGRLDRWVERELDDALRTASRAATVPV
jgi:AcrR family transcriptional regulator